MEDIKIPFTLEYTGDGVESALEKLKAQVKSMQDAMNTKTAKGGSVFSTEMQKDIQATIDHISQGVTEINNLQKSLAKPVTAKDILAEPKRQVSELRDEYQKLLSDARKSNLALGRLKKSVDSAQKSQVTFNKEQFTSKPVAFTDDAGTTRLLKSVASQNRAVGEMEESNKALWASVKETKQALAEEEKELERIAQTAEQTAKQMTEAGKAQNWETGKDIGNRLDSLTESANATGQAIKEALEGGTGASEEFKAQLERTAKAMKETLTPEQQAAKDSLKNARSRASANYYLLRSLKMLQFQINANVAAIRRADAAFISFGRNALKAISKLALGFRSLHKSSKSVTSSHNGFLGSMKSGFMTVLKYTLGIRSLYFLFNKLRKALGDGMGALAMASSHVNGQMSAITSNLSWMKNMAATAAQPLLNVLVPAMDAVAHAFDVATKAVASFFATLTGQSFIYRAIKPTEDYAKALDKTGKSAKKAKDNLQSFDELHVISDSGSGDAGGQFQTAEIESAYSDVADKVKDILSTLFEPIKKGWDAEGKFVMDSWEFALERIKSLIGVIGRDFLTVWSNDTGVAIWTNILHIVGDVGLIAGHLANNFTDAWTTLAVGRHILENIQTIVAIIIQGIRDCADATVEWSKQLDFLPILTAIYNFTEALKVPIQTIVNILSKFWIDVVLPFRKYMIESGLPDLLNILTAIAGAIDWDLLESRMSKLMEAFEPFLENTWQAFLIVLSDLGTAMANLVNSDTFGSLIDKLSEWMTDADPDELAKKIEHLAIALIGLTVVSRVSKAFADAAVKFLTFRNMILQGDVYLRVGKLAKVMGTESGGLASVVASLGSNCRTWMGIMKNYFAVFGIGPTLAGLGTIIGGLVLGVKDFIDMWQNGVTPIKAVIEVISGALVGLGLVLIGIAGWPAIIIGGVVGMVVAIVATLHEHWDEIKSWFTQKVAKPASNRLKKAVKVITDVTDTIAIIFKALFKVIGIAASAVWNLIKGPLMAMAEFVNKWVVKPITKLFDVLWSGLKSGFKLMLNFFIGAIESFLNGIINKINFFLGGLESIGRFASRITGDDYGGITRLDTVSLPRLAQGAVIPPNKEFMAILGDQKSGTNIEAPLETIQDAVALVLQPYLERLISITEDIYEKDTSINLGDKEIARAAARGQRKLGIQIRTQ